MGKIYNVSFDSTLFYGGANNNRRTYVTNWQSILPDKLFKVTFSFMSGTAVVPSPNTIPMTIQMDLGQSCSYAAIGTTAAPGGFQSSFFLGNLFITGIDTNEYYFAETKSNPPVYTRRPSSNITEVRLHNGLTNTNFTTPVPSDYLLTLCFEELD